MHPSPSPSPSLVSKPMEAEEDEPGKEIPMALDRTNIAPTSFYKQKKMEHNESVNLDSKENWAQRIGEPWFFQENEIPFG